MTSVQPRSAVFRDVIAKPVIWKRDPNADIICPLCHFEHGPRSRMEGQAWAYLCMSHWRTSLIGTRAYHCPHHQREVSPLMIPGIPVSELIIMPSAYLKYYNHKERNVFVEDFVPVLS